MKRFFFFVNQAAAQFLTVLDASMEMRSITAALGQIEKHVSQKPMSRDEISENIAMALQRGFQEVDETEFQWQQTILEKRLHTLSVEKMEPTIKVVDWEELGAEDRSYFQNDPIEYLSPGLRRFCVYDEPVHATSDILLRFDSNGPTAQTAHRNLIFKKGLTIDGNLDAGDFTSELPLFVLVVGDLRVHNLLLTGWAELVVTGNLVVTGTLFGFDGEAGGRLKVHGDLSASKIVGGFMYLMQIEGSVVGTTYWLDQDEPSLEGARIVPYELSHDQGMNLAAHTELVDESYHADSNWATGEEVLSYHFDGSKAVEILRRGSSLFR